MTTHVEELLENTTWLRRLARTLVADEHAAEDLVQEACSAGLAARVAPRDLRSWLAGVVRKLALRAHRERSARRRREEGAALRQDRSEPAASHGLEQAELQQKLLAAVLALEEPYRATVLARYFEGASLEALAQRDGVPGSTVRTRLARALERLRQRLDEDFGARGAWALLALDLPRGSTAPQTGASPLLPGAPAALGAGALVAVALLTWAIALRPHPASPAAAELAELASVASSHEEREADEQSATHSVRAPAAPPQGTRVAREAEPAGTSQPLTSTWRIAGRVTDPDGAAVPDAEVLWCDLNRLSDHRLVTRTDGEGRYAFTFPTQAEALEPRGLAVRHPSFIAQVSSLHLDPSSFADGAATLDVGLERGTRARFLVTDERGQPIPDAKLRVTAGYDVRSEGSLPYADDAWIWRDWSAVFRGAHLATGRTDADGGCELDGIMAGTNHVLVWAQGWLPAELQPLEVAPGWNALTAIVLERGRVPRGIVVDPAGSPVAGASVYCCLANQWSSSVTRADGTFEVGGLPRDTGADKASYAVVHPDFAPFWCGLLGRRDDLRLPLEGARIELDPGRSVELRLVDADTGLPVQGPATLEVERVSSFVDGPVREATLPREFPLVAGALRAERIGRFVRLLWIDCPGYDIEELALEDPAAGTGETIRLRPARTWQIELVDATSGEPVLGATLRVHMDTSPSPELPAWVSLNIDAERSAANRIALDSRRLRWTDRWSLSVNAPGHADWQLETTADELRAGPDVIRLELERP